MGFEGDLTGILREVVQFLDNLRDIKLPADMEQVREGLLARSRDTLMGLVSSTRPTGSPEPYLDMNAGSKGLILAKADPQLGEYIGAEESPEDKHQDYYETFQEVEVPCPATGGPRVAVVPLGPSREDDPDAANVLFTIYSSMSAVQIKSKCQKYGPLDRKEGKKLFVFEQYRSCWVGLIGSHLLIYANDRNNRPCAVHPIRGYMARPAPSAIPRDQRRSESAFEIFRPGSRTLQFIAKSPSDMEDWVANICRVTSTEERNEDVTVEDSNPEGDVEESGKIASDDDRPKVKEESYQNVIVSNNVEDNLKTGAPSPSTDEKSTSKEAHSENSGSTAPPLPARIPRKLPSLPVRGSGSSYEPEEEEEDDIYHKIEDFRDSARYQNVKKCEMKIETAKTVELPSYDDTRSPSMQIKVLEEKGKQSGKRENENRQSGGCEMTYDDIANAIARDNKVCREDRDRLVSYDDVGSLLPKTTKNRLVEKTEEVVKSPQKKSFLYRVRSRRESPKKTEKKVKRKTATPPPVTNEELPTYDDVSDLLNLSDVKPLEDELPEYNCPPPPRPVFAKQSVTCEITEMQDFYDDVSACREMYKEETSKTKIEQPIPKNVCSAMDGDEARLNESTETCEEGEHYQTPRKDTCRHNQVCIEQEELYDDVAILADFTARQRIALSKKDAEESKLSTSPEKKPWNRFVSVRKTRSAESTCTETNVRTTNGIDEMDELSEHQGLIRMNTFQRLISKMENSLGKAATKTAPSPFNKTNIPNNS